MKKKNTITLLLVVATFVLCANLAAQRSVNVDGTHDLVTLNNIPTKIVNLLIVDSLGQNLQGETRDYHIPTVHLASFEIELTTGDAINILKSLYAGINGQQLPLLVINKLNAQGLAVDEREFAMVTVKEIDFLELNAALREPAKAKVIIQAHEVSRNDNPGNRSTADLSRISRMSTGNKFRLVMSDLPAEDVLQIGKLKIAPSSSSSYLHFSLDIPSSGARAWSDWLSTSRDHQGKDATISLLDATGSQAILSIELSQVEIVSISIKSNPGNISRTTIRLRTNQIPALN